MLQYDSFTKTVPSRITRRAGRGARGSRAVVNSAGLRPPRHLATRSVSSSAVPGTAQPSAGPSRYPVSGALPCWDRLQGLCGGAAPGHLCPRLCPPDVPLLNGFAQTRTWKTLLIVHYRSDGLKKGKAAYFMSTFLRCFLRENQLFRLCFIFTSDRRFHVNCGRLDLPPHSTEPFKDAQLERCVYSKGRKPCASGHRRTRAAPG